MITNFSSTLIRMLVLIGVGISVVFGTLNASEIERFSVFLNIFSPFAVSESSGLEFFLDDEDFLDDESIVEDATSDTSSNPTPTIRRVTISPDNPNAARLNITGAKNSTITASVVEPTLTLTNRSNSITIENFQIGGTFNNSGEGVLDNDQGSADASIGATAIVPQNAESGTYSGTLTFRVLYR